MNRPISEVYLIPSVPNEFIDHHKMLAKIKTMFWSENRVVYPKLISYWLPRIRRESKMIRQLRINRGKNDLKKTALSLLIRWVF